jgi:hypothetical protein
MANTPQDKSLAWFKKLIQDFQGNSGFLKQQKIAKIVAHPMVGRLNHFWYDPKLKATLPYYDRFPLVIPLNYYPDGFLGLNLHYLPPDARLSFFEDIAPGELAKARLKAARASLGWSTKTKVKIDYPTLKHTPYMSPYSVCIKRYLYGHMKSPFLDIEPTYWEELIMLPTQKFVKGSPW